MFDPYYKWLGIPPKDQPPNHYRLLSLELYERDLDVIEGSADRLMGFVRQYQSGENAAEAARILNELATARMCLLKPQKKAEYDAQLRKKLSATESPSELPDLGLALAESLEKPPAPKKRSKTAKSKSGNSPPPLMIAGGAVVVCVLLAVIFQTNRPRIPDPIPQEPISRESNSPQTIVSKPAEIATASPAPPKQKIADPESPPAIQPQPDPGVLKESNIPVEVIGEPVDLLGLVDLNRDVVAGEWQRAKTTLIGSGKSKVYLPSRTPDDYQLKFAVRRTEKADSISIGFMMSGRQGVVSLDAGKATVSGLSVDNPDVNDNCTTYRGKLFQGQSAATVTVTVHPGHLHTAFNGQTIVDWFGDPRRLMPSDDVTVPCRETPFLVIADARYAIASAELVPIKPEPAVSRLAKMDQELDILPNIDLDRDVKQGVWAVTKSGLSSPGTGGKIALPVYVPEEYTLSANVELPPQHQGGYCLVFGLVAGESYFQFVVTNYALGIDAIDGKRFDSNDTALNGSQLKPGKSARIDCTVTNSRIRMEIDGKTYIDWMGDPRRLSIPHDWAVSDARSLVLGTKEHVKFRDIKIGPPIEAPKLPDHPPLSVGTPFNLLAMIDPLRDAYGGTWQRDGTSIRCLGNVDFNRLGIPVEIPDEYQLNVRVARTEGGARNNECLYLGLPVAGTRTVAVIDGGGSATYGVQIDGGMFLPTGKGPVIPPGGVREIAVVVRKTGLKITSDKKTIFEWTGNPDRVGDVPNCVSPGRRISLGSWNQGFRFEKLMLTPLKPTSFPEVQALPTDGKLLSIIDPDRDSLRNQWKIKDGTLECPAGGLARLRIPAKAPDRYAFSFRVMRKQGDEDLLIGLPVGNDACMVAIDGDRGHSAGLDVLDRRRFYDKANLTNRNFQQPLLPKDQSVLVRCIVTPDSILVTCGDLEVIRWHGDSRRFSMMNEYSPANMTGDAHTHLWLGSWQTGFLFRDLELKPLTDSEAEQLSKSFSGVFPITSQSDVPLKNVKSAP